MTNGIAFIKMHGLGNDFVVINATKQPLNYQQLPIAHLANRHTGIGFDQLLIIEHSTNADFFCRIFNSDGSEAEQCGNGLRCVARYIHEEGLVAKNTFAIETKAGVFPIFIQDYHHIRVTLPAPEIQNQLVDFPNEGSVIPLSILSVGNPHAVVKVDSIETVAVGKLAKVISASHYFLEGANVGFMQIITPHHAKLRTVERGAGETFACGSNACASACAGIANGWLKEKVQIEFNFGSLWIEWAGNQAPIYMTGPASRIFSGTFFETIS